MVYLRKDKAHTTERKRVLLLAAALYIITWSVTARISLSSTSSLLTVSVEIVEQQMLWPQGPS